MFKKFIKMIIRAENKDDAINDVFYGENGIDMAYQKDKISWEEFEMLSDIIAKMA